MTELSHPGSPGEWCVLFYLFTGILVINYISGLLQ